ncbi:MAG: ATP-binding protein, partial [Vicinamibacterales bacterium]
LAGGVAHDFNNLLTSILGYTDLLIEQLPEEGEHQSHLAEVRRAAESAAGLTRQLLAFGRRQIVEPRVLDLREVVNGLLPMLRRTIGEQVRIDVDMAGAGGRIKADPVQMEQVILNLAINARDAMPRGGTLRIDLSDIELDDNYVRQHSDTTKGPHVMLAVSDTGSGMDAATQARVFEPFFTTKAKGRGTGLGLSTVLGIVQQSGGTVWLYSEVGRGSTFKVLLPRVEEPLERTSTQRIDPERLVGSETILIVEDEKGVRALVRRILEGYGYTILSAAAPQQALDLVAETTEPIQLLISDIVLPDMPGPELAARIVAMRPGIGVLYSSGYTDGDIVQRGILAEGVPFLQKPYLPAILGRKVREILDGLARQ